MKRLLLGLGLAAGIAYALREWFAAPQPQPSWDETDNDPEDLSQDLAQRAREAEGRSGHGRDLRGLEQGGGEAEIADEGSEARSFRRSRSPAEDGRGVDRRRDRRREVGFDQPTPVLGHAELTAE